MAFSHVQGAVGTDNQSGTTISVTLTNTVGSGNAVMGGFQFFAASLPTISVTDDKSNTYTVPDTIAFTGAGSAWGCSFELANITNAPKTITVTFGASVSFARIIADEFSGVATASALDVHTGKDDANVLSGTDTISSGATAGAAASGDLVYGVMVAGTTMNTPPTAGTGYTLLETGGASPVDQMGSEWETLGASAAVTATFSTSGTVTDIVCLVMAFKAAAGFTAINRRTLSSVGTRVGVRQPHGWG